MAYKKKHSRKGMKLPRWESEEDEIILKHVANCPQNFSEAYRLAARELQTLGYNRSPGAVSGRFNAIRDTPHAKTTTALVTRTGVRFDNRKNAPIPRDQNKEKLRMEIVKESVDKMDAEQKKVMIKYLLGL